MQNFFDWFATTGKQLPPKPWLILGKGPSFEKRHDYDLAAFHTVGLNHVVREQRTTFFHTIDLEVVGHLQDVLAAQADYVILPWRPHLRLPPRPFSPRARFRVSDRALETYLAELPVLQQLSDEGRLLWYNLVTAPRPHGESPVVRVWGFSSTAVLNLLAEAGIKQVRSLGVDGGVRYSSDFKDLEGKTLLAAGQASFDQQFIEIARTIMDKGVDFAPLDLESPIKVFVGTQAEQMLCVKVLEYTIRKHTSMTVEVVPLFQAVEDAGITVPQPADPVLRSRTPFSFQRFAIPALKGYRGRAIYVDSDMQVFRDIRELWAWPFEGAQILSARLIAGSPRRPQHSVMVLDCEALAHWKVADLVADLERGRWTYEQFMYELAAADRVEAALPHTWNDLERYEEGQTALIHYTDMNDQPWLATHNVNARHWCQALMDAVKDGFIPLAFVRGEVEKGWVRPSLLYQLEHGIVDPLLLPAHVVRQDRLSFTPPHVFPARLKQVTGYGASPGFTQGFYRKAYALTRHLWKASGTESAVRKIRRQFKKW